MGWRKTGEFHKPREIKVCTCDQCNSDIGTADGYGQKYPNYEIQVKSWAGCADDPGFTTYSLCSLVCLQAMARRLASGERVPVDDDDI